MELKQGAYYKTRGGRKAFVACIMPPSPLSGEPSKYPFKGYTDDGLEQCWMPDGRLCSLSDCAAGDLVAEWREPRTLTRWACMHVNCKGELYCGSVFFTRDEALSVRPGPLAIKRIDFTEGEFDE